MSSAFGQYHHYSNQGQLLVSTQALNYGQDNGRRSKSPMSTSMINHPRHSPVPLSTPPHSRNSSQPPEQLPNQLIYEDVGGSPSDSPTSSIATPDQDASEIDMMDFEVVHNYHDHQNAAMVSSHMQQDTIPAIDTTHYLPDQVLQDVLNAAVASQSHQYPFGLQSQPFQNMLASRPYDHLYGQTYGNQPPHRDPWTSQRPQQNPNVPRSGDVVFDPETEPMDYSAFVNADVSHWTHNNTDPNYLVSPNEPLQSQNTLFNFGGQAPQSHMSQRPLEMRVTVTSPPPPPYIGSLGTTQSSPLFIADPVADTQVSPISGNSSSIWCSVGQLPQSPYQESVSPQVRFPSPGDSDSMVPSYQRPNPGLTVAAYVSEPSSIDTFVPVSPPQVHPIPSGSSSGSNFEVSPEPESRSRRATKGKANRKGKGTARGRKNGGRTLGTHLDSKRAKEAHDMRKTVVCWHCALQRDKCGPGDTCDRCAKREKRPNADIGLGCSRVKLIDLAYEFLPTLVTQMHEDSYLTHFVTKHIRAWNNTEITIMVTCGQDLMPRIPVKVYEFVPSSDELLFQIQYRTDPVTHKRYTVRKASPALGMLQINRDEEKRYDEYISTIVDHHVDAFGELCWMDADNDFQQKLFWLMTRVRSKTPEETALLREVFRLIVVTFVMSHVFNIAEETKHATLSKMHSYAGPGSYVDNFTTPRMANRQLKHFFARIQRTILSTLLSKLQQFFRSSNGCDKWLTAFIAVLGMCMAQEEQQMTIHQVMATKAKTEGVDMRDAQCQAETACRDIDAQMNFIFTLFRWKYNRKYNPLANADRAWDREVGFGDQAAVTFVRHVAQLVDDNKHFLRARQLVSIAHTNQEQYTSRFVAQFLMSFYGPQ